MPKPAPNRLCPWLFVIVCLLWPPLPAPADTVAATEPVAEAAEQAEAEQPKEQAEQAKPAKEQVQEKAEPADKKPAEEQEEHKDQRTPNPLTREDTTKKPEPDKDRQRLDELNEQIRQRSNELQRMQQELEQLRRKKVVEKPLEGVEEVKKAVLPEDPTREQVEAYLAELREALLTRTQYSSSHLVVTKIRAIPPEYTDLLVDEYLSGSKLGRYMRYALNNADESVIRKRVAETLDSHPHNISLIVTHGWCKDAEPAIRKMIEEGEMTKQDSSTMQWFQAAVELQDKSLYPRLHEIAVEAYYWESHIAMLSTLPDYDLAHTLEACINKVNKQQNVQPHFHHMGYHYIQQVGGMSEKTALLAAEAGKIEGLDALMTTLYKPSSSRSLLYSRSSAAAPRLRVYRFIRFRGSNSEVSAWYQEHRDQLVFDHHRKQFVLPEPFPGTPDATPEP